MHRQHELTLDWEIQSVATAANVLNWAISHDIGGFHAYVRLPSAIRKNCDYDFISGDSFSLLPCRRTSRHGQVTPTRPTQQGHVCTFVGSSSEPSRLCFARIAVAVDRTAPRLARANAAFGSSRRISLLCATRLSYVQVPVGTTICFFFWPFVYRKPPLAALLPYLYTAARGAYDTGIGLLRPVYYAAPLLDAAYSPAASHEYMFGPDILAVCAATALRGIRRSSTLDSLCRLPSVTSPPVASPLPLEPSGSLRGGGVVGEAAKVSPDLLSTLLRIASPKSLCLSALARYFLSLRAVVKRSHLLTLSGRSG